ncbi:iron ABC transporter substrate-binding protein, partial [Staphylococcus aureus]
MKKTVLYLVLAVMFLLAACGNNSDKEQSKSETKGSKDTVKIENNYK